ncbi:MAG: TipAS antibiotic-recognition domain-containing protein, partial [Chitinophagales bacterium]
VCDQRFTDNIDKYRPGLAAFLRDAMHFYCDNL